MRNLQADNLRGLLMPFEASRRSAIPYRFGVALLCCGALVNWLGLADVPPVRYLGIACLGLGSVFIAMAVIFWVQQAPYNEEDNVNNIQNAGESVHVINIDENTYTSQKPPDYASLTEIPPPSYDAAIALNPSLLFDEPKPNILSKEKENIPASVHFPMCIV